MIEKTHNKSKGIAILGSTGSIGVNTLNVIRYHPKRFHVVALAANRDVSRMLEQCAEFQPKFAVLVESDKASQLQSWLKKDGVSTRVLAGSEALQSVASLPEVDYVMAAIVGAAGLLPSLAAAQSGKRGVVAN
jgi:1-deoxy-D-xylulose-5-phosphate reductoisomerase